MRNVRTWANFDFTIMWFNSFQYKSKQVSKLETSSHAILENRCFKFIFKNCCFWHCWVLVAIAQSPSQWLLLNIFVSFAQETIGHHAKRAQLDLVLLRSSCVFPYSFIYNNHHYRLIPIEMSLKINILPDFFMNYNYFSKWKIKLSLCNIISFAKMWINDQNTAVYKSLYMPFHTFL